MQGKAPPAKQQTPDTPGSRLRRLREEKGLSQAALGAAVGVTGVQIGRYEHDKDTPGGVILLRLSEQLGVSSNYLAGRGDDPLRQTKLPAEWEDLLNDVLRDECSPEDIRRAIRLLKAAREIEKRED